jgi:hypothetical protein
MTLYNPSLSFVDVHVFGTGRFNYFSWSYVGSKRSGEYEIAYAHLFSFMTDQRDLKLCTMLYSHLDVQIVLKEA